MNYSDPCSFCTCRKFRNETQSRIITGLSINLLALDVTIVAFVERTSQTTLCKVIAMAMHYFLLSSFAWMVVEAIHLYLKVIRVFNSDFHRFITKAIIFAQGEVFTRGLGTYINLVPCPSHAPGCYWLMYILRIAQQELNPDRGALLKHEKNTKNLSDDGNVK